MDEPPVSCSAGNIVTKAVHRLAWQCTHCALLSSLEPEYRLILCVSGALQAPTQAGQRVTFSAAVARTSQDTFLKLLQPLQGWRGPTPPIYAAVQVLPGTACYIARLQQAGRSSDLEHSYRKQQAATYALQTVLYKSASTPDTCFYQVKVCRDWRVPFPPGLPEPKQAFQNVLAALLNGAFLQDRPDSLHDTAAARSFWLV